MLLPNETIGKQIAYCRKKYKLTQKDLATITGIRLKHLSDIETGRTVPQIHTLTKLAAGLGVSIDELNGM